MQQGGDLERKYVKPEILTESIFSDGITSSIIRTGFVFKTDDGLYRMLYQGSTHQSKEDVENMLASDRDGCFIAVSRDGIHFEPEDVSDKIDLEDRIANNQILNINLEIAEIIEDKYADPSERYKMMLIEIERSNIYVRGDLLVSSDLLH